MKKIIFILCLITAGNKLLVSQTLFSYGKQQVSKDEFVKAFYKNNPAGYSEQALTDYLNLYINFKLKVQAAKDMKLDTLASQKNDLQNFRQQIIENYLSEDSTIQALSKEAFVRSQKDIRAGHIFIPFDNTNPYNANAGSSTVPVEDTAAAYKKINEVYKALQQGTSFSKAALRYSMDPAAKRNHGDIGFVTAFTLPYAVESILYNLKPGNYSVPYRSNAGYHIFINQEERPAYGKIKAAQILLPYTPGMSQSEKSILRSKADSIYNILKKNGTWENLAQQYNISNNPSATNGAIPDVVVGKYDPIFEKAVFALKSDGDITPAFETSYGIHIVKRLGYTPASADSTQATILFKTAVMQDGRLDVVRKKESNNILRKAEYKKVFSNDALLWEITDSLLVNGDYLPAKGVDGATVLFSFAKKNVSLSDWWTHIQTIRNNFRPGIQLPYELIMQDFVSAHGMLYYQNHLEDFNPSFKAQLTEFAEGNLLFDVMEKQIWNRAAKDEKALQKYYSSNKTKYQWGPSITGIYFTAENDRVADRIRKETAQFVAEWRSLAETTSGKIIADSARFELTQLPGVSIEDAVAKLVQLKNESADSTVNLVYITAQHPANQQKSFEEARGLVINDYQSILEEKWIASLKKKYKVKVNEGVLGEIKE